MANEIDMKQIAILGSTGSIGTQTLDVVRQHPNEFSVYALSAHRSVDLLIQQALEFNPAVVCIADESCYARLRDALHLWVARRKELFNALHIVIGRKIEDIIPLLCRHGRRDMRGDPFDRAFPILIARTDPRCRHHAAIFGIKGGRKRELDRPFASPENIREIVERSEGGGKQHRGTRTVHTSI